MNDYPCLLLPRPAFTWPAWLAGEVACGVLDGLGEDALGHRAHAVEYHLQASSGLKVDLADHRYCCTSYGQPDASQVLGVRRAAGHHLPQVAGKPAGIVSHHH